VQVQLFPAEQIRIVKLLVETVIVPRWHPTSWPRSWTTRCRITSPKVPQAVFCLLTALRFHELTTQLPRQIWIAMPRGSHVLGCSIWHSSRTFWPRSTVAGDTSLNNRKTLILRSKAA